jgi:cellulose biosynthesis protein BcsQ
MVSFLNRKGGVGKTSLTANVGALAALSGWRVLCIDLDSQANLGRDLGYRQRGLSDDGADLRDAVISRRPPVPIRDVRPNLDVIPAGEATDDLAAFLTSRLSRGGREQLLALSEVLEPLATEYDLILADCPPNADVVPDATLLATHYVVIPTTFDDGSLDGLTLVAGKFRNARELNPDLELLGISLFNFGSSARRLIKQVTDYVDSHLGPVAPILGPPVRLAQRPAADMRKRGEVAHEYEARAGTAEPWYKGGESFSEAGSSLAGDYQQLTRSFLSTFQARQTAYLDGAETPATS